MGKNKLRTIVALYLAFLLGLSIATIMALFVSNFANASESRIIVIDSGIKWTPEPIKLCKTGHKDFTGKGLQDIDGHGTNVASLISQRLPESGICIIIYKVFHETAQFEQKPYIEALRLALNEKPFAMNLSIAGYAEWPLEISFLKAILDRGVLVFAAAGNRQDYLSDLSCKVFPACADKRIFIVGAQDLQSSGKGPRVNFRFPGRMQAGGGQILSGSSQATANATGSIVAELLKLQKASKK
jgi:subtilisin family serine protease